ncbi:MAG: MBL fold metallo-hydrolase [Rhizobiaceae bacterium]|nr:MBL fold metallo-hydrolase [Hyphomicrobiales bacterium]NRB32162.1 MBL fold metallo-hydrolase [Rhizobiaceae bacterium]
MQLKWYGQAAFRIVSDDGLRIVCDPYTPEELGFAPITDEADIVITSSDNDSAHCRYDLVPGNHEWLNALKAVEAGGATEVGGLNVSAVEAMEIETHPLHHPEANAMYRFEVDGIKVAHMGDCGNDLNEKQTDFLRGADVLLALTGAGGFVISLEELMRVINETKPRLVVPMHFRTLNYKPRNMEWIEAFLAFWGEESQVDFAFGCEVNLSKEDLPDSTRVLVLDYAR